MKALRFDVSVPRYLLLKVLGRFNRRLFYRGPLATLKKVELPEPPLPSPDWVRLRSRVCGFCASDLNLILLRDSPAASPFTSFPCVLGHEIGAEVVEAPAGADDLQPGDRVTVAPHLNCAAREITPPCRACRAGRFGNCENFAAGRLAPGMFIGICAETGGGFGEYLVAHRSQVFKLPRQVDARQGALIEPLAVALQTVLDNRPTDGENVLIIGGGVIGSLLVQSIRALGPSCRIAVAEPATHARSLCRRAGADDLIAETDFLAAAVELAGATPYRPLLGPPILQGGFERIFDTVATSATLDRALRCLAVEGVLSVVGIGHAIRFDPTPLWLKLQTIRGVFSYGRVEFEGRRRHVFEIAVDWVGGGRVNLDPLITHTFELDDFARMISVNLDKRRHRAVKTAVVFDSG